MRASKDCLEEEDNEPVAGSKELGAMPMQARQVSPEERPLPLSSIMAAGGARGKGGEQHGDLRVYKKKEKSKNQGRRSQEHDILV